jgi:outer membrane protein assembly factor BamB
MKRITAVLATTSAAVLALTMAPSAGAAVSPGDWAQRGAGPGHTSQISSPGGLNPNTVAGLHRVRSRTSPIVAGFAVADGVIYGTTLDHHLVATSATDGHVLWSTLDCGDHEQNSAIGGDTAPAVTAGAVWLSDGQFLTGVRRSTGQRFACLTVGNSVGSGLVNTSPTVAGGVVYTATARAVLAFDASTGGRIWRGTLPSGWQTGDAPVVDGGLVFVPAGNGSRLNNGGIFALSARDGSVQWMVHTRTFPSGLAATGGRVYAGGSPGAWNEQTGAEIWTRPAYDLDSGVSISGGRVYLFGGEADSAPGGGIPDGDVIALDANTGQKLWETAIADEGEGVVTVGNGVVYVTDAIDIGVVYVINAATGAVIRQLSHPAAGGFYLHQPAVVDGKVYLGGYDDNGNLIDTWGL